MSDLAPLNNLRNILCMGVSLRAHPLLIAVGAALFYSSAFQLQAAPSDNPPSVRPKIALVLSGGGARGIAHIGVLKVLREQRVPVDFIVSTSMGSIVGGAYAAGRTPEEMEALVSSADWATMFTDRPPRQNLSFRRKEDDLRFIGQFDFGIKREGIVLSRGAVGAQNIEEFLKLVSSPGGDGRNLDQLPIPFRAVATDLVTGELVLLRDVKLPVAMRASMSIPGAFAPTEVDGRLLGDGGLTRNLPVEVALDMGADVIIAVNVGTPLLPRDALSSVFGIAQQMIYILSEQNVATSLKALRPTDILISPELSGVNFVDFERGAELVTRGETAARSTASRLADFALSETAYATWEANRRREPLHLTLPVADIRIEGAVRTNPQALKREVMERTDVAPGRIVSDEQLVQAGRILYGTGEFERVDARAEARDGSQNVVIEVEEKTNGPDYLRVGGRVVSNFRTDSRYSLTLQHTRTWLNSWGAEWRNEIQIGELRRLATSLYQPLGSGSPWFVEPVLETIENSSDVFGPGNRRTDRITTETNGASLILGRRLGNIGVLRFAVGYEHYRSSPLIGSLPAAAQNDNGKFTRFNMRLDTLDDANFPRSGYLVSAETTTIRYSSDTGDPLQANILQVQMPVTYGRFTLLGQVGVARSRNDRGAFSLGGFLNLSGTSPGTISGSQAVIADAVALYRMGALPKAVGRNWYTGLSLEVANAWSRNTEVDYTKLRKAMSAFVGFDTSVGPLYLAYGHTFSGDSALYLYFGRPTESSRGN
jgi:NTE family protein